MNRTEKESIAQMAFEYNKVKSASKDILPQGSKLSKLILRTMEEISKIVGDSLGPHGRHMALERFEHGLPPILTKDGVTIFRSLGFDSAPAQCILEIVRDAAVRTASEAGDGPQPLWSKVLTPSGFVQMKDVKVGMEICGTDGTTQRVLGIFPKGRKEIFKVTFEQGQTVECCEDHLWEVTTSYGMRKILTTGQMMTDYKSVSERGNVKYRYFVRNTVIEYGQEACHLPIDPYFLGVLIGDGSLTDSGSVELSLGIKKEHIISKLHEISPSSISSVSMAEGRNSFRVKLHTKIRPVLEEIGLRNTDSYTKHIPELYLRAPVDARRALLRGLIDTDGHINVRGRFEFSTVSARLASDFTDLCRSLGIPIASHFHERKAGDGSYSNRPIYRFSELAGYQYGMKISDISGTGNFTEMQCIKVSNPDCLYITDDFVPTHNTTTATILSEAVVRRIHDFCEENPRVSPQQVVRYLEQQYSKVLEPTCKQLSQVADLSTPEGRSLLKAVATVSANGDVELAEAVMQCYDLVGDDGNVTIVETAGPSGYHVEAIDGYPINSGYEDSCLKFYPMVINDQGGQKSVLENPVYILYHGAINDINTAYPILTKVKDAYENFVNGNGNYRHGNVVLFATAFSEQVLATLCSTFTNNGIKILPVVIPKNALQNSQSEFLHDMAALVGAQVFDPVTFPLDMAELDHLGPGTKGFESTRYRSTVLGRAADLGPEWEDLLVERLAVVEQQVKNAVSEIDGILLRERYAKLSNGIAKLVVTGPSNGELKEKRDRAEDAVCAVRGAIQHGVLPGGGWALIKLAAALPDNEVNNQVLKPALLEPVHRLLLNAGYTPDVHHILLNPVLQGIADGKQIVYNVRDNVYGDAKEMGLLDSTPAVREAVRNSISIASLVGTLGGIVSFPRDKQLERSEAQDVQEWLRNANINEADERA